MDDVASTFDAVYAGRDGRVFLVARKPLDFSLEGRLRAVDVLADDGAERAAGDVRDDLRAAAAVASHQRDDGHL